MLSRIKICSAIAFGAVWTGPLCAQTSQNTNPDILAESVLEIGVCLEFGKALEMAVDYDTRAELAQARVDRARSELELERGADRPQISAFTRTGLGDGVQADNELDNRFGVRVTQRLFSFGRGKLARDAARARARAAIFGVSGSREEIAGETGLHFLQLARSREEIEAAELMSHYYRQAVAEAPRRLDSGLLKLSESTGLQAEFTRFEVQKGVAELDVQRQMAHLSSLTGEDVLCVVSPSAERSLRTAQPPTLEAAISEASTASPELLAQEAELAAAKLDRERISRSNLPDIGVAGTSAFGFGGNNAGLDNNNRVGVDINWPVYSGGQNRARTDAASAEARIAAGELERQRRAVSEDVQLSWVSIQQLQEIVELNRAMLQAMASRSEALEREYDAGLITLTELIDARQEEFQGRLSEIDARYDLLEQQLLLARRTGRMDQLLWQD